MKSIIKLGFILFVLCLVSTSVWSKNKDREKLIQEKTRRSTALVKQLKKRNHLLKKRKLYSQMNFVIDEFAKAGKPYIPGGAYADINARLRLLHLQTGLEYYVLLTPNVPLYIKGTESKEQLNAIKKQLDDEAYVFSKNVANAASVGDVGVGNGVLMTYVRQEIAIGKQIKSINDLPEWIKKIRPAGKKFKIGTLYFAKPLAILGSLFKDSGIQNTFEQKIFDEKLGFKKRSLAIKYLSYALLRELLVFSKVKNAATLNDLSKVFSSDSGTDLTVDVLSAKLKTEIETFESNKVFDGYFGGEITASNFNLFKNGFETTALEEATVPVFNYLLAKTDDQLITNKLEYVLEKADGKQAELAAYLLKVTFLSGKSNYKQSQLIPIINRFLRQKSNWIDAFRPTVPYYAKATPESCLQENLHYMSLAFADFLMDRFSDKEAEKKRKTMMVYIPVIPRAFLNHQVLKEAGWDDKAYENIINLIPIKTTFQLDAPTLPSFSKYAEYISKSLDNIKTHYGANLTAVLAKEELETLIAKVRDEIESNRALDLYNLNLRQAPDPTLFEEKWTLKPYQPGTVTTSNLPDPKARVAYRAMRRAFAYFFGSTQGVGTNNALLGVKQLDELTTLLTQKPWKGTASAAFSFKDEKDGILGVQDFWQKASPELRQEFKDALQCITKIEEVTKSCARDLLKIYLKGLFGSLPTGFPQKFASLKSSSLEFLKAPRYQLVRDFFEPVFKDFSVFKLTRLIGGIVAIVKGDDLVGIQAPQAVWAANVSKIILAWFAAGIDPAKLALIVLQVKMIAIYAVVTVVAIYATIKILKALWQLAKWVAKKVRDFLTDKEPGEEEEEDENMPPFWIDANTMSISLLSRFYVPYINTTSRNIKINIKDKNIKIKKVKVKTIPLKESDARGLIYKGTNQLQAGKVNKQILQGLLKGYSQNLRLYEVTKKRSLQALQEDVQRLNTFYLYATYRDFLMRVSKQLNRVIDQQNEACIMYQLIPNEVLIKYDYLLNKADWGDFFKHYNFIPMRVKQLSLRKLGERPQQPAYPTRYLTYIQKAFEQIGKRYPNSGTNLSKKQAQKLILEVLYQVRSYMAEATARRWEKIRGSRPSLDADFRTPLAPDMVMLRNFDPEDRAIPPFMVAANTSNAQQVNNWYVSPLVQASKRIDDDEFNNPEIEQRGVEVKTLPSGESIAEGLFYRGESSPIAGQVNRNVMAALFQDDSRTLLEYESLDDWPSQSLDVIKKRVKQLNTLYVKSAYRDFMMRVSKQLRPVTDAEPEACLMYQLLPDDIVTKYQYLFDKAKLGDFLKIYNYIPLRVKQSFLPNDGNPTTQPAYPPKYLTYLTDAFDQLAKMHPSPGEGITARQAQKAIVDILYEIRKFVAEEVAKNWNEIANSKSSADIKFRTPMAPDMALLERFERKVIALAPFVIKANGLDDKQLSLLIKTFKKVTNSLSKEGISDPNTLLKLVELKALTQEQHSAKGLIYTGEAPSRAGKVNTVILNKFLAEFKTKLAEYERVPSYKQVPDPTENMYGEIFQVNLYYMLAAYRDFLMRETGQLKPTNDKRTEACLMYQVIPNQYILNSPIARRADFDQEFITLYNRLPIRVKATVEQASSQPAYPAKYQQYVQQAFERLAKKYPDPNRQLQPLEAQEKMMLVMQNIRRYVAEKTEQQTAKIKNSRPRLDQVFREPQAPDMALLEKFTAPEEVEAEVAYGMVRYAMDLFFDLKKNQGYFVHDYIRNYKPESGIERALQASKTFKEHALLLQQMYYDQYPGIPKEKNSFKKSNLLHLRTVKVLRDLLQTYLKEGLIEYESLDLNSGFRSKLKSYTRDADGKYPQMYHSVVFIAGLIQLKIPGLSEVRRICQNVRLSRIATEEITHNIAAFKSNNITTVGDYETWKEKIKKFRREAKRNEVIVKTVVPGDPYPLYRVAKGWEVYGINADGTHVKFNRQGYIKREYVDKYLKNDSQKLTGLFIRKAGDPVNSYGEIILLNTLTYEELSPAEKAHPVNELIQNREAAWWNKSLAVRKGKHAGKFIIGLSVPVSATFYSSAIKAEWINFLLRESTWKWVEKVIDVIEKL